MTCLRATHRQVKSISSPACRRQVRKAVMLCKHAVYFVNDGLKECAAGGPASRSQVIFILYAI